jgi:UrcA family protein
MTKLKTAAVALLVLAGAQTATGAMARTADAASPDTMRIVVKYGDLNLATREGAEALRARVVHAAMLIKGDADPRDLQAMAAMRKARDAAVAMADAITAHQDTALAAIGATPSHLPL